MPHDTAPFVPVDDGDRESPWPARHHGVGTADGGPRIVILGTTGAGKSTLAATLAAALRIPCVELDALYHGPGWTPSPVEEFRAAIAAATSGDRWIAVGNYVDDASDLLWPRANVIVWLDISPAFVLPRLLRRSLGRIIRRTELWGGNRENWSALVGRNSLLLWALSSHWRHRRDFPVLLAPPSLQDVAVVRLCSAREVAAWRDSVARWARSGIVATSGQSAGHPLNRAGHLATCGEAAGEQ